MSNIIEVKDLNKKYGPKIAVNNLSFNVKEGILFSFLGSNGAGKTTTISILTTILNADAGDIKIGKYTLSEHNDAIRHELGVVFQESMLDDLLTVEENLITRGSFYFKDNQALKKQVLKTAKLLKLESYLKQTYGTLSGGEKRRVDIARALLHEPRILFLDEPTTGLDPANRRLVWQIIKKLQQDKKITVFLTTHYMEEANESDVVAIIDHGQLIAYDTPTNLKIKYSSDLVKMQLINSKDKAKIKEVYTEKNGILHLKSKNSHEALKLVNKYQSLLESFEIINGNMDDVFLNITGSEIKGDS